MPPSHHRTFSEPPVQLNGAAEAFYLVQAGGVLGRETRSPVSLCLSAQTFSWVPEKEAQPPPDWLPPERPAAVAACLALACCLPRRARSRRPESELSLLTGNEV